MAVCILHCLNLTNSIQNNLNKQDIMSEFSTEKPKAKGFKPFAVLFIGLIVILVVIKLIMVVLM